MSPKPRMTLTALSVFMLIALALFSLLREPAARAADAPEAEIRALYERFAAALHGVAALPLGQRRHVVLGSRCGARAHGRIPDP